MTRTILIVDDDPTIRKLIATTLEDVSGYRLQEASNGAEAVERAVRERPEIVFLDVDMPRVNGIEACRRLREGAVRSVDAGDSVKLLMRRIAENGLRVHDRPRPKIELDPLPIDRETRRPLQGLED